MLENRAILAVVPARSGSRGIKDKNLRILGGVSLIGRAGRLLSRCPFIDRHVLSTDSEAYAEEGRRHGLDAPFLRPPELSGDAAGAVETVRHALLQAEQAYSARFDVILIVEPTSPIREEADLLEATRLLLSSGADSVVSVSPLDAKHHPSKILRESGGRLGFYNDEGARIVNRQELPDGLYSKNGVCYALSRACLVERGAIFTEHTLPLVIRRPTANIDSELDLLWAQFLLERLPAGTR